MSILLGLATSFAPGFAARSAHVDEASLVSATAEICALSHHGSDSGHSRDDGCCCLQATARRDPTLFVAIFGVVEFVAPDTLSFAARSDASQRAGVARPTTPWLSRAPPSFS
ncbi:hypothetical protein IY145_24465 [Methylosinus sp. H3A]|uniref:hypothetical protein n=1 Tax=Methylosinus sp. H3A TaxID=2785786 RepID=UPI0018C20D9D|nr:hypothetical protein [Methylosinus sp. H3A]MBG0812487.1 hypothetical protein [Methylosinus sp. H3A]